MAPLTAAQQSLNLWSKLLLAGCILLMIFSAHLIGSCHRPGHHGPGHHGRHGHRGGVGADSAVSQRMEGIAMPEAPVLQFAVENQKVDPVQKQEAPRIEAIALSVEEPANAASDAASRVHGRRRMPRRPYRGATKQEQEQQEPEVLPVVEDGVMEQFPSIIDDTTRKGEQMERHRRRHGHRGSRSHETEQEHGEMWSHRRGKHGKKGRRHHAEPDQAQMGAPEDFAAVDPMPIDPMPHQRGGKGCCCAKRTMGALGLVTGLTGVGAAFRPSRCGVVVFLIAMLALEVFALVKSSRASIAAMDSCFKTASTADEIEQCAAHARSMGLTATLVIAVLAGSFAHCGSRLGRALVQREAEEAAEAEAEAVRAVVLDGATVPIVVGACNEHQMMMAVEGTACVEFGTEKNPSCVV